MESEMNQTAYIISFQNTNSPYFNLESSADDHHLNRTYSKSHFAHDSQSHFIGIDAIRLEFSIRNLKSGVKGADFHSAQRDSDQNNRSNQRRNKIKTHVIGFLAILT